MPTEIKEWLVKMQALQPRKPKKVSSSCIPWAIRTIAPHVRTKHHLLVLCSPYFPGNINISKERAWYPDPGDMSQDPRVLDALCVCALSARRSASEGASGLRRWRKRGRKRKMAVRLPWRSRLPSLPRLDLLPPMMVI